MRKARMVIGLAIVLALAVSGAAYAGTSGGGLWHPPFGEVLLEGDVLTNTVAAAVAQVGADATVVRAETDAQGNAAYEVHMVLADGSRVTVFVDEAFAVVSVVGAPVKPENDGDNDDQDVDFDEPRSEQRADEILLEGDVLAQVVAAATAQVEAGATVIRAETDADGNALYEVHMVTADGKKVTVYVDAAYAVVKVAEKGEGSHFGKMSEYAKQLHQRHNNRLQDGETDQTQTQDTDRDRSRDGSGTGGGSDGRSRGGGNGGGSRR